MNRTKSRLVQFTGAASVLTMFLGMAIAALADGDISKPGKLDIDKLQTVSKADGTRATTTSNASVGGYLSHYFSFDLSTSAPTAMILLRDMSPFGKVNFHHLPIELVAVDYTDQKSGVTGDVYSADVPENGRRYFLLGAARRKSWIVYYDAQGQVQLYMEANIGYVKN